MVAKMGVVPARFLFVGAGLLGDVWGLRGSKAWSCQEAGAGFPGFFFYF